MNQKGSIDYWLPCEVCTEIYAKEENNCILLGSDPIYLVFDKEKNGDFISCGNCSMDYEEKDQVELVMLKKTDKPVALFEENGFPEGCDHCEKVNTDGIYFFKNKKADVSGFFCIDCLENWDVEAIDDKCEECGVSFGEKKEYAAHFLEKDYCEKCFDCIESKAEYHLPPKKFFFERKK